MINIKDFDYNLPKELIAQVPVSPRDHSRLLVLNKNEGTIEDRNFFNIVDYLKKGDLLIMNNSKVFPARLFGKKLSGGKMEVFLHRCLSDKGVWQCLVGGRGAKSGLEVFFEKGLIGTVLSNNQDGTWEIKFNYNYSDMMEIVEIIGKVPLPPYIKRDENVVKESDKNRYQTVYADDAKPGSVAAPTAGLHFTPEILDKLKRTGVQIEYVTLHVGLGTFAPVKVDDITKHKMHAELVEIEKDVIERIIQAKKENRRIIGVGTTSVRSLEAFFDNPNAYDTPSVGYNDWVNIFIYPGYKFKIIDGMITNFHLPKSTLLMLISALAGKENIDKAYRHAMDSKYRFFSYGDAMLIL